MNLLLTSNSYIYVFFTLSLYVSKLNNSGLSIWTLYYAEINGTAHLYAVVCGTVSQIVYSEIASTES